MLARWPLPRWRSTRRHPHKGADLEGHLTPEVFRTPIDCQANFLLPLAVRRMRRRGGFKDEVRLAIDTMVYRLQGMRHGTHLLAD